MIGNVHIKLTSRLQWITFLKPYTQPIDSLISNHGRVVSSRECTKITQYFRVQDPCHSYFDTINCAFTADDKQKIEMKHLQFICSQKRSNHFLLEPKWDEKFLPSLLDLVFLYSSTFHDHGYSG